MRLDLDEPRLDLGSAQRLRAGFPLGEEICALAVGGEHGRQRRRVTPRRLLREKPDAVAARHDNVAAIGQEAPADQVEQGRLAGAVAPDEAELAAIGDLGVGLIEEGAAMAAADAVGQAGNRQHRGLLS